MAGVEQIEELADSLNAQAELTHQLLDLLKVEYHALSQMDGETLHRTMDQKRGLVDALETLHQEFQGLARDAGTPVNDKAGMERLIAQCDPHGDRGLDEVWQTLSQRLAECQRQNEVNGMIIVLGHQSVQHLLAALQGLPPGSLLYDPQGQTRVPAAQNVLAKV